MKTHFTILISNDNSPNVITCLCIESFNILDNRIFNILNGNDTAHLINQSEYVITGPKLNNKTPWCSNMLEIFKKCNINKVLRIEKFNLY